VNSPFVIYSIRDLSIKYGGLHNQFELRVPDLQITQGEMLALTGASGCGKSTFLDVLALISSSMHLSNMKLSFGNSEELDIASIAIDKMNHNLFGKIRRKYIGYVLQSGGLLPFLSVRENIEAPLKLNGLNKDKYFNHICKVLDIQKHLEKKINKLSRGERQRVAIARSLVHQPKVIIADEPTASLDNDNADKVMELFVNLAREQDVALIVASHDKERMKRFGFNVLRQRFIKSNADELISEFSRE